MGFAAYCALTGEHWILSLSDIHDPRAAAVCPPAAQHASLEIGGEGGGGVTAANAAAQLRVTGPIWAGPLHDESFVSDMAREAEAIYICVYVCVYIYIYVCIYMCVCMYEYIYILYRCMMTVSLALWHERLRQYIYVCMCVYTYIYVCVCIYIYIYIYVYIYVYIYIHIGI